MAAPLRPYQAQMVADAREAYKAGKRSILLVLPTGGGKTRTGGEFVLSSVAKGKRVLWLAHRKELILQARERLQADGIGGVSVVSAQIPHLYNQFSHVQVASLQTLLARNIRPQADLVVFDEAHHYVASEWHQFAQQYSHATVVGLTATPQRSDGTGLGLLFDTIVAGPSIKELTSQGFLVPCDVWAPSKQLKGLAQAPHESWNTIGQRRPAIVFCRSVKHAEEVTADFKTIGAQVAMIDGKTPPFLRDKALKSFQCGLLDVLVNVFVLTEGFDAPRAEVCILARGCENVGTFLQMVGRVLRPAPGKSRALLIDLPGASWHPDIGLPDEEREYKLDGSGIVSKQKTPFRQCLSCGHLSPSGAQECDSCGAVFPAPELVPQVKGAKLEKVDRVQFTRERAVQYIQALERIRSEKNYKPGWVPVQFKIKFGSYPHDFGLDVPVSFLPYQPF